MKPEHFSSKRKRQGKSKSNDLIEVVHRNKGKYIDSSTLEFAENLLHGVKPLVEQSDKAKELDNKGKNRLERYLNATIDRIIKDEVPYIHFHKIKNSLAVHYPTLAERIAFVTANNNKNKRMHEKIKKQLKNQEQMQQQFKEDENKLAITYEKLKQKSKNIKNEKYDSSVKYWLLPKEMQNGFYEDFLPSSMDSTKIKLLQELFNSV